MNNAAHTAAVSILAIGGGGSGQRLTPQTAGLLSGVFAVVALWTLSNLWRPPKRVGGGEGTVVDVCRRRISR